MHVVEVIKTALTLLALFACGLWLYWLANDALPGVAGYTAIACVCVLWMIAAESSAVHPAQGKSRVVTLGPGNRCVRERTVRESH